MKASTLVFLRNDVFFLVSESLDKSEKASMDELSITLKIRVYSIRITLTLYLKYRFGYSAPLITLRAFL